MVEETAKECGVRFNSGALEYLAGKIGAHPRMGVEETRKLATYLGAEGGEITEQMIIDMVPDFGEGDFFEASEAFFSGKLDWAVDAIDRHFFRKGCPPTVSHPAKPKSSAYTTEGACGRRRIGPKPAIGKRPT